MRYTFGASAVLEGFEVFALPDDVELLFGNLHNSHHVLPFVLFANQEFVLGGEDNPAAFADQTNEGHLALYQLKITLSPVIVDRWITQSGMGCELLGCSSFQGRQTVGGIDGGLQALHCFVELFLCFEGLRAKQEATQQTIQVLHHTIAPGLAERNEDRLYS